MGPALQVSATVGDGILIGDRATAGPASVSQLRRITCQKFAARAILAGDMVEWKSTLFINSEILSSIPDGCSVFLISGIASRW